MGAAAAGADGSVAATYELNEFYPVGVGQKGAGPILPGDDSPVVFDGDAVRPETEVSDELRQAGLCGGVEDPGLAIEEDGQGHSVGYQAQNGNLLRGRPVLADAL